MSDTDSALVFKVKFSDGTYETHTVHGTPSAIGRLSEKMCRLELLNSIITDIKSQLELIK